MTQAEIKEAMRKYGQALQQLRSEDLTEDVVSKEKADKINNELDVLEQVIRKRPEFSTANQVNDEQKFQNQYHDAFVKYLRNGVDTDLINLINKNGKDAQFDSNGFSITPNMQKAISNSMFANSPIRQMARVINVSHDKLDLAAYTTDIVATWGDDRTVADETDAFTKKTIEVNELTAQPKITQKMVDDNEVDHEGWIAELLSDIFSAKEDNAFLNGDGVNKPVGILSYEEGTASNQIERVNGGSNITLQGLLNLQASLDGKYERANETAFITSKAMLAQIRSIKDDSGSFVWTPGALFNKQDTLFGTPIFATSEMDTTSGDAVIYANLRKGYQIVDRSDIKIQRDPYSSKPFVIYFATKRVGGDVIDTRAIKVLKLG